MLRANEVNQEMGKIEINFKQWLEMSNLEYKDFLKYRYVADFQILSGNSQGYTIIVIGSVSNGQFARIGEQFAYREGDMDAFQDLSLLLLYIAERLDKANKAAPAFEQRGTYFYDKIKKFIMSTDDYKKMNK